jgi:hypothetical protein
VGIITRGSVNPEDVFRTPLARGLELRAGTSFGRVHPEPAALLVEAVVGPLT